MLSLERSGRPHRPHGTAPGVVDPAGAGASPWFRASDNVRRAAVVAVWAGFEWGRSARSRSASSMVARSPALGSMWAAREAAMLRSGSSLSQARCQPQSWASWPKNARCARPLPSRNGCSSNQALFDLMQHKGPWPLTCDFTRWFAFVTARVLMRGRRLAAAGEKASGMAGRERVISGRGWDRTRVRPLRDDATDATMMQ